MNSDGHWLVSVMIVLSVLVILVFSSPREAGDNELGSVGSVADNDWLETGRVELAVNETHVLETKDLPKGRAVVSDPDLVKFGDTWRLSDGRCRRFLL